MTRVAYVGYLAGRVAGAALVAAGSGALAWLLLRQGLFLRLPAGWPPAARESAAGMATAVAALLGHVLLGPKQRRPVFRRFPGALYVYAGIPVDRNAGCRGGCVTGATGSGKTMACILPRLHSLCVNQPGIRQPAAGPGPAGRRTYREAPWGGLVCGEKGNEWQVVERLLRHHGRAADVRVLRSRPADAPVGWQPPARLNLLSVGGIPADTYARLIVETSLAVEEAATRDEFFVPQARDKIAWGLRLIRAAAAGGRNPPASLLALLDLLTVPESYRQFLARCLGSDPALAASPDFAEARFQLENNYWNQPPEQLGGVRSTISNFLGPFAEADIAAVFCADSTFDLREVEEGLVLCVAIPQRFALQRRYVSTLLKALVYQVVLERFDRRDDEEAWRRRNIILVEQDEWQRHAVRADCEVDLVREAGGAVYAATQSQNAVWLKLGGREKAAPLIANLRNRWICQAATAECAEESSALLAGRREREVSYSHGEAGRTTTVSFVDRPLLARGALRTLPPFHVVFAPAEGPWLYRRGIAMPVTPEGEIPAWWLGDWNPLHWAAHALGLPARWAGLTLHPGGNFVPPWRAAAPLRAQLRWLAGLDGTFIVLQEERAGGAQ